MRSNISLFVIRHFSHARFLNVALLVLTSLFGKYSGLSFPENKLLRVQVGVGPFRPQYSVFLKADGMAVILVLLCEGSLLE